MNNLKICSSEVIAVYSATRSDKKLSSRSMRPSQLETFEDQVLKPPEITHLSLHHHPTNISDMSTCWMLFFLLRFPPPSRMKKAMSYSCLLTRAQNMVACRPMSQPYLSSDQCFRPWLTICQCLRHWLPIGQCLTPWIPIDQCLTPWLPIDQCLRPIVTYWPWMIIYWPLPQITKE